MAGYFTSNSLIADIKRRAFIPSNQSTFTTADFLAMANSEMQIGIVPTILSLHEEYYVFTEVTPIQGSKSSYTIPHRAIGGRLRDVFYRDTNGNLVEMSRIAPEDKALYQSQSGAAGFVFFYVENNNIVLVPSVGANASGDLVFTYFIRPNELVEESRVGVITAISTDVNAGTTIYSVSSVPSGFSTSTPFDLLQAKPGHKVRSINVAALSINPTNKTITFRTADVDVETEIGDHIAFAGECIVPQIPCELHPVLSQRVAARCLEALGDTQGLTNANTKLQEMEMKTIPLIDDRVDGAPKKIVNNRGLLTFSKARRRRWY